MNKPKKSFVSDISIVKDRETIDSNETNETIESSKSKSAIDVYIDNFNPLEKIAYEIAKSRLKTSFDIEKSIGYKK